MAKSNTSTTSGLSEHEIRARDTESNETSGDTGNSGATGTTFSFADGFNGSKGEADNSGSGNIADAPVQKKRRGRTPYPRDAQGNIIRPTQNQSGKDRLASVKGFVPNNREKLRANIQGIHQAVAGLTQQPIFLLTDTEANDMSTATADLFDQLEWNITGEGGSNIYIAAFLFAVTVYRIEVPRAMAAGMMARARNISPTAPATPGEARAARPNGGIDFSADIENAVNAEANRMN